LRAGTSAVLAALDMVAAGAAARVLVAAADCRLGEPESPAEQSLGDAGAALLVGDAPGLAEGLATHTLAEELLGTWRTSEQQVPRTFPGAFETRAGYGPLLARAAGGALAAAGVPASEVATVVLPTPNPRAPLAVAKALGLDPKRQLQDGLWSTIGDTGTAQPLLLLVA